MLSGGGQDAMNHQDKPEDESYFLFIFLVSFSILASSFLLGKRHL